MKRFIILLILFLFAALGSAQTITGYGIGETDAPAFGILPERTGTVHVQGHADGCCGTEVENYLTAWLRGNKVATQLRTLGFDVINDEPVVDGQRSVTWQIVASPEPFDPSGLERRIKALEATLNDAIKFNRRTTDALIGKIAPIEAALAKRQWYDIVSFTYHNADKPRYFLGAGARYKIDETWSVVFQGYLGGSYQSGYGASITPEYSYESINFFAGAFWRGKKNRNTLRSEHWIGPIVGIRVPLYAGLSISTAYEYEKQFITKLEVEKYSWHTGTHVLIGTLSMEF